MLSGSNVKSAPACLQAFVGWNRADEEHSSEDETVLHADHDEAAVSKSRINRPTPGWNVVPSSTNLPARPGGG